MSAGALADARPDEHLDEHPGARVAVAGRHRLVVEAVGRSLAAAARALPLPLESCPSIAAAREQILRARADLVVLVIEGQDCMDARDLVDELVVRGQHVVVVGQMPDPGMGEELAASGAVVAPASIPGLVSLIERLLDEAPDAAPTAKVVDLGRATAPLPDDALSVDRRTRRRLNRLTLAEARILWHLMHGMTVTEIAREHVVSVETVRSQTRTLLAKLGVASQLAAVALAWQAGWQPPAGVFTAA